MQNPFGTFQIGLEPTTGLVDRGAPEQPDDQEIALTSWVLLLWPRKGWIATERGTGDAGPRLPARTLLQKCETANVPCSATAEVVALLDTPAVTVAGQQTSRSHGGRHRRCAISSQLGLPTAVSIGNPRAILRDCRTETGLYRYVGAQRCSKRINRGELVG